MDALKKSPGHYRAGTKVCYSRLGRARPASARWLQGRESNPRPPGYEPGELPLLHLAVDSCGAFLFFEQVRPGRLQVQQAGVREASLFAELGDGLARDLEELRGSDVAAECSDDLFDIEILIAHGAIEPKSQITWQPKLKKIRARCLP